MLRTSSYIIAKTIITIPFVILYSIFALGIPGWLIQNYSMSVWFKALLLWSVHTCVFEFLAECIAVWVKDKVLGMLLFLSYWIASFLFSGLFLPKEDLLSYVTPLYYGTPFSYYIRSMFYLLFNDVMFETCDKELNPFEPICVESGAGADVIEALNNILPLFENKDTFMSDIGVLVAMLVITKTLSVVGMILKSRDVSILE
jgi:hypothetical protein